MTNQNEHRLTVRYETAPFRSIVLDSQYGLSCPASDDGTVEILGMVNLQDGRIVVSNGLSRVAISEAERQRYLIRKHDLLFNRTNSAELVGKSALADRDIECVFASYIVRFKLDGKRAFPPYVAIVFSSAASLKQIRALATPGVSQYNINPSSLQKYFRIPLPPRQIQKQIVAVAESWDRAIDRAERLLAAKERRKRALAQQLLTGKKRFSRFVKSATRQSTKVGQRPSDWNIRRIADFAVESGARNGESDDIPVLSCTKHQGLVSSLEYFGKRVFSTDTSNYKVVRRGEFAYATNHIEEGSIGLLDLLDEGLVSPMYTVFCVDKTVEARFLYALFKTETYRRIFAAYTNGSVNRRGGLRWNDFKLIQIALPSLDEQRQIASTLDTLNEELDLLRTAVTSLKRQKSALVQKLLAGEIRVGTRKEPIINEA